MDEVTTERQLSQAASYHKRIRNPQTRAYHLWNGARQRARKNDRPFEITLEDIERRLEVGRCEVTGVPFELDRRGYRAKSPWAPSLDRINSDEGYTTTNTRVVVHILNQCKNTWTDGEVETFCRAYLAAKKHH